MMSEEVNAYGWDAIDQELLKVYGEQEPKHYGTVIPYLLGEKIHLKESAPIRVRHQSHTGIL